jgi:hypothetical protein
MLLLCLCGWIASVANTRVYELHPYGFGPFQFLPPYYWFLLLITILLTIFLSQIHCNVFLKIAPVLILGLFTIGTVSIINPYARSYPDAYCNVDLSNLIFHYGTINYGNEYTKAYPTSFLFIGILQELTGITNYNIARFFPLFLIFGYFFGILSLGGSISNLFGIDWNRKFSIICLSFLSFTVFLFSLGIRTDPSPQTFGIILLPYFLASYVIRESRYSMIALLLLLTLVSTHMMTSFIAILLLFWFLFLSGKHTFYKLIFPLTLWFGWVTYVGIVQLKWGINYIIKIWEFEFRFEKSIGGITIPGSEIYAYFRLASIFLIGLLFIISLLYLMEHNKKLTTLLLGFVAISSVYVIVYFLQGLEFLTRVVEINSIFVCLVFGFGMSLIFADFLKLTPINSEFPFEKILSKNLFIFIIIIIILLCSFFSILTSRKADVSTGTTQSEINGFEFALFTSDEKILYPILPPIQHATNDYTIWTRIVRAWDAETKGNAYKVISSFKGIVVISQQWKIRQQILEVVEWTSLSIAEILMNENHKIQKIYDNGNFIAYRTNIK